MPSAKLIIHRGLHIGKMLDITSFPATLGRDPSNTVQIDDEEISRFHSRIKCRGKLFIIEDLNSQNGTYLNGDKILNAIIQNDEQMIDFAIQLQQISQQEEGWIKPEQYWDGETLLSDLSKLTEGVSRQEYLGEFIENVDIIFSKENKISFLNVDSINIFSSNQTKSFNIVNRGICEINSISIQY